MKNTLARIAALTLTPVLLFGGPMLARAAAPAAVEVVADPAPAVTVVPAITANQAVSAARAALNTAAALREVELETEHGVQTYKVKFAYGSSAVVNAATGAIISIRVGGVTPIPTPVVTTTITAEQAVVAARIALSTTASVREVETEREHGVVVFSIKFADGSRAVVDATTGAVISSRVGRIPPTPGPAITTTITMDQAVIAARAALSTTAPLREVETEREHGVVVFSIKFADGSRAVIDATTGAVISIRVGRIEDNRNHKGNGGKGDDNRAVPATPATPATPGRNGQPAVPATPATPATPANRSGGSSNSGSSTGAPRVDVHGNQTETNHGGGSNSGRGGRR